MDEKGQHKFSLRKIRRRLISILKFVKERIELFFLIPGCYLETIRHKECTKSKAGIILNLLELFFIYKISPESYSLCWLWEVRKSDWKYYFGSNYRQPQRMKLAKSVQPSKYQILFADKDICERLCRSMGIRVPITLGIVRPDQNYRAIIADLIDKSGDETFFIKPVIGGGGHGIVVAKKCGSSISIQCKGKIMTLDEFNLLDTVIVQEAIRQDKRMSVFSSYSINTIRIVTMYTKRDSVLIIGATLRCGVSESYVDNWSSGGVAVGIHLERGRLRKYGFDKKGNRYLEHPTSKVTFENFVVPEWAAIVDLAKKVQKAFPCYRILGLDVALQEEGIPVLIEINEAPDLLFQEQTSGPLLKSEINLMAFGEYDLLINKFQRTRYNNLLEKESAG